MRAVKGNKVYTIEESQKRKYQEAGYDILDDKGVTIAYGRGKTVSYEEYAAVKKELDALKADGHKEDTLDFSEWSLEELKAYAEQHGIDVGRATSKAGILEKVREAEA